MMSVMYLETREHQIQVGALLCVPTVSLLPVNALATLYFLIFIMKDFTQKSQKPKEQYKSTMNSDIFPTTDSISS